MSKPLTRRSLFAAGAAVTAGAAVAGAQAPNWEYGPRTRYPDPGFVTLDPRFAKYVIGNTPIQRLHTGSLWAEGPAWSSVGRYFLWSDIPNNIQRRIIDDTSEATVFRNPSGNSNGNTFDYHGRQLSCEHGNRRVVRYELDGSMTVLADAFEGKPLNAPNDIVVHPNTGDIWFTDPGYGSMSDYEGHLAPLELKEAVYRIDGQSGAISKVADDIVKPNGLCFSPDYSILYVADTGVPVSDIKVWDVNGGRLTNRRVFVDMRMDGFNKTGPADGVRADIDGNIWVGGGGVGDGYDGVHVFAPNGDRIGLIKLPETCANICFGGVKRNRLFMAASQSIYAVYVGTRGAHIT
jgi:gluconolactonase